jgi:chromosomal replication initiation ATPase DnaA
MEYQVNSTNILEVVSKEFDINQELMIGPRRTAEVVDARDAVCFLMYLKGCIHHDIAMLFNRDRSTITYAIRRVKERIKSDAHNCYVYCKHLHKVCFRLGLNYNAIVNEVNAG